MTNKAKQVVSLRIDEKDIRDLKKLLKDESETTTISGFLRRCVFNFLRTKSKNASKNNKKAV